MNQKKILIKTIQTQYLCADYDVEYLIDKYNVDDILLAINSINPSDFKVEYGIEGTKDIMTIRLKHFNIVLSEFKKSPEKWIQNV